MFRYLKIGQRPNEIDYTLRFGKSKRTVDGMGRFVGERRVGGEFAAALGRRPDDDGVDESARDALPPRRGLDVESLEEGDRGAGRAVDIVHALRRLDEARGSAVAIHGNTHEV